MSLKTHSNFSKRPSRASPESPKENLNEMELPSFLDAPRHTQKAPHDFSFSKEKSDNYESNPQKTKNSGGLWLPGANLDFPGSHGDGESFENDQMSRSPSQSKSIGQSQNGVESDEELSEESDEYQIENNEIDEHLLKEKRNQKRGGINLDVEKARILSQMFTFKSKNFSSDSKSQFLEVPCVNISDSKNELMENKEITIAYSMLESPDANSTSKWKEVQADALIDQKKSEKNGEIKEKDNNGFIDFDHYVNSFRGIQELPDDGSEMYFPKFKVDKILVLKGKKVRYPRMILSSRSKTFFYWSTLQLLCIVFDSFVFPLLISFTEAADIGLGFQIFIWTVNVVHMLDLILVFRRTFFEKEKNEEIVDWREIAKHELRSWSFWTSAFATLPWQFVIYINQQSSRLYMIKYLVVIRLLKLIRLNSLYRQTENYFSFKRTLQAFRAGFLFLLLIHLLTCFWYAVVLETFLANYYSEDLELSKRIWQPPALEAIEDFDAINAFYLVQSKVVRYIWTMFSVIMLMSGNEMFPPGIRESMAATFISVCGSFTLGYIYGNMSMAIENLSAQSLIYYNTLDEVQVKMEMNHISDKLQRKVYEYLEYCWKKRSGFNDDRMTFANASLNQQRDICFFRHQEVVLNVPLFRELEPIEVLSIIQRLKTNIYMPGDKIIREGEKGQEMYFITEGTCEVVIKRADKNVLFNLTKRQYFGEIALISNSTRTSDVNALEFCILEMFSKKDYLTLQEEYPGIKKRLRAGLKNFKMNSIDKIRGLISSIYLFDGLSEEEFNLFVAEYLEDLFLDQYTAIVKPKKVASLIGFVSTADWLGFNRDWRRFT